RLSTQLENARLASNAYILII
ncbi:hypothetical protein CCACVL1_27757, partial [Corchorus capsularis]